MKKMLAIAMMGFVTSFMGCGTEDDPTLGIDQEGVGYGEEAAAAPSGYCAVANGLTTGLCVALSGSCVPFGTLSCTPGMAVNYKTGCASYAPALKCKCEGPRCIF